MDISNNNNITIQLFLNLLIQQSMQLMTQLKTRVRRTAFHGSVTGTIRNEDSNHGTDER